MNATITFDTLAFAQNFIDARFTDKQAKALTQFQKEAIGPKYGNNFGDQSRFLRVKRGNAQYEI